MIVVADTSPLNYFVQIGGWPRLNSEKRFWVAYPFGFGS